MVEPLFPQPEAHSPQIIVLFLSPTYCFSWKEHLLNICIAVIHFSIKDHDEEDDVILCVVVKVTRKSGTRWLLSQSSQIVTHKAHGLRWVGGWFQARYETKIKHPFEWISSQVEYWYIHSTPCHSGNWLASNTEQIKKGNQDFIRVGQMPCVNGTEVRVS